MPGSINVKLITRKISSSRPQDVLFSDDPQQTAVVSDESLAESELPEHVHHRLNGRLVGDGDGRQVHDLPQLEWRGAAADHRDVLSEDTQRVARQRLQPRPRVLECQQKISPQHKPNQVLRLPEVHNMMDGTSLLSPSLPGHHHRESVMVGALQQLLELGHSGGVLGQHGQRLIPLGLHHVSGQGGVATLVLR